MLKNVKDHLTSLDDDALSSPPPLLIDLRFLDKNTQGVR